MTTTLETVEYYQSLLAMQYLNKPNATGQIAATVAPLIMPQPTVQQFALSPAPVSGSFILVYGDAIAQTTAIAYSASANDVDTAITTALSGIYPDIIVAVEGTPASGTFTVTISGISLPAQGFTVKTNTTGSTFTIVETDVILPLAVMNGFNLLGDDTAVGAQLDMLGKYAGVTRSGLGFSTNIILDDADYLSLIRMAIAKNSAGSSLATIQEFIHGFFGDSIQVFDYQTMVMSYFIDESVGSSGLVQLFIRQGLLPRPMGVGLTVFYPASLLFSFRTVEHESSGYPFNTVADYNTTWTWLSANSLIGA